MDILWDEITQACLQRAKNLLDSETTPTAATVEAVKGLVETAIATSRIDDGLPINSKTQGKFSAMMRTGDEIVKIIRSVPEDKSFLLSMAVDAFLSGMTAGERLALKPSP